MSPRSIIYLLLIVLCPVVIHAQDLGGQMNNMFAGMLSMCDLSKMSPQAIMGIFNSGLLTPILLMPQSFMTLFSDIQQGKVSAEQMVAMMNPMLMAEDSMKIIEQCSGQATGINDVCGRVFTIVQCASKEM